MKVSIITPTFNRPKYLKRAIESVQKQTHQDWELIVVDDNPPESQARDETCRLMGTFTDPRIRYVQNDHNMGGSLTRNHGIDLANGQYIAFLDDDDEYLPHRIQCQLAAMECNGWDVSVMDGATYNQGDGSKVSERHQRIQVGMTHDDLMRVHLLYHISGTNTFMFRADYLRAIGGFPDAPSCQEWLLMERALEGKGKFGYLPEIHIRNYQHEGEQLSTGAKKLTGQAILYEHKKRHFSLLTPPERRQVRCRHHGVLFFAYFKMKHFVRALSEAFLCFACSPLHAIRWLDEYKGKLTSPEKQKKS